MKFTYFGHSCFTLVFDDVQLLFDPFISPNERASDIDVDELRPDYILLSHGHEDHVADLERIVKNSDAKLISNFELVSYYGQKGVEGHPLNHGGQASFPFGRVKYVTAIHSSVLPDGTYGGNPGGFVIQAAGKTIYFAGDTALTYDMKLIPEMGYDVDVAILPIGDNFTMGPQEALRAADFVQSNRIIGVHFDTFPYIQIDHQAAISNFKENGKTLLLPAVGDEIEI
ncbi:MAG: metal-dependent hydrolase [Bacteroidetes bacterium]|jgi:L-ascorbate metabolism protein UlaG (beta-lactamase superfamily)|nr:metal-dependent hydrolase [Bacteroidota bacterium]